MTAQGPAPAGPCNNAYGPVEGDHAIAVNRPGENILFEFRATAGSPLFRGDLRAVVVSESDETLAEGADGSRVVLDVSRSELARDARMVSVRAYVCDTAMAFLDVEVAASFFAREIPADYSATR